MQAQPQAEDKPRTDIKASHAISAVPPAAPSAGPAHKGNHALGSKASSKAAAPSSHALSPRAKISTGSPNDALTAGPRYTPAASLAGARATAADTVTTAAAGSRHTSAAGLTGGRAPGDDTPPTAAAARPRQNTAVSDRTEAGGGVSMTTAAARPRLNSAAAIFEPRHQAQAKRDMTSQRSAAGLAAARTTGDDAFTTAAAKPRLNSAASDGPEARGGEIGVDLNKPSAQAVPDRQVYSLDDTFSSALQELLLTEDRRDFAQVIQALLSNNDDAHLLTAMLTASWHKLHGASWRPIIHPDVTQLQFASTEQTVAAARAGLDRVFRKAGSIDPELFSPGDSPQPDPAVNPRRQLPFKLHYSNRGYQMILKKGWEEGKGLGIGAKGRAEPFIPPHQSGEDAHLGLGRLRYKNILTGMGAEHEIKDAVMRLCHGPAALFTTEAAVKAIAEFLSNLPQDSGAPPAEGLSWVGDLLGRLIVNGALTLQQTHALVTAAAAAKAGQGHMAAGEAECRQHVMRGAISVLAQYISSAELQQQMKAAGLQPQHNSAQARPHKEQHIPVVPKAATWADVAAGQA
ncbi:hypothetical protein WJX82_011435 [Trebouxia sp. C0006]